MNHADRLRHAKEKPVIVCELLPHPNGNLQINNQIYRPTWPQGTREAPRELLWEIISQGAEAMCRVYANRTDFPRMIRVERYDEKTRVIVQE